MLTLPLKNQKGLAMIEIVPLLAIFVLLLNFAFGFFGIIHSGILNSIAARNYAFETFRNKPTPTYLRDTDSESARTFYGRAGFRFHGVLKEESPALEWYVTQRPIRYTDLQEFEQLGRGEHERLKQITERKLASEAGIDEGVNPVWIRTLYGLCVNADCGARSTR